MKRYPKIGTLDHGTRRIPNPGRRNGDGKYLVLRVEHDNHDTYAVELHDDEDPEDAIGRGLDRANPDPGNVVEWGVVEASDAGAARLKRPPSWKRVTKQQLSTWSYGSFDDSIREGMARAIWVTSWATWIYEQPKRVQREHGVTSGVDLAEAAPETPDVAQDAAITLYGLFEKKNDAEMGELFQRAMDADEIEPNHELAELFGHYLAMQALGEGVSWFDDHSRFPLKFPTHFEAHTDDGEDLWWSPQNRKNK